MNELDPTMNAVCDAIEGASTFAALKALGTVTVGILIREAVVRRTSDPKSDAMEGLEAIISAMRAIIEMADYEQMEKIK